jgi:uncharacterized protein (DUF1800 family)
MRTTMAADWSEQHVQRVFWRAGFGATPQEVELFTRAGRARTLEWLVDGDGGPELAGPEPHNGGQPLDPVNEWGHDVVWWIDRMVRTRRPLVEKMTLFWHDHFAVSDQDTPLMLRQNRMLRRRCLGDFRSLLRAVTVDHAMQLFLSLADSSKEAPNENFARELMELFTLGRGYTERDIREAARALTGFRARWDDGFQGIYYSRASHDPGTKRIFRRRGRFDWRDVLRLVVQHREHPPFIVGKLWGFFVTGPLDRRTRNRLVRVYLRSRYRLKPVVAAILDHPALYADLDRPDMVKAPAVFVAGLLRQAGTTVTHYDWSWITDGMGQRLFRPPSVAGWDWGPAWLSTNTMRMRFQAVTYLMRREVDPLWVPDGSTPVSLSPAEALARAHAAVGRPWATPETLAALEALAGDLFSDLPPADRRPSDVRRRQERADHRERVLRHLLLSGPDNQLC